MEERQELRTLGDIYSGRESECALITPTPAPNSRVKGERIRSVPLRPLCPPGSARRPWPQSESPPGVPAVRAGVGRNENYVTEPHTAWRWRPVGLVENGFQEPTDSQAATCVRVPIPTFPTQVAGAGIWPRSPSARASCAGADGPREGPFPGRPPGQRCETRKSLGVDFYH